MFAANWTTNTTYDKHPGPTDTATTTKTNPGGHTVDSKTTETEVSNREANKARH